MILRHITWWLPILAAFTFSAPLRGQCPYFYNDFVATSSGWLCEGAMVTFSLSGANIPAGSAVEYYIVNGTEDPYMGDGVLVGSFPVTIDDCGNTPEVLYIMVNPDDQQVGSANDKCDEFILLWTGSGNFNTSDIIVSNLSDGTAQWNDFVEGNAAMVTCGTALMPGPVPPNAFLIIQGSNSPNLLVDTDDLCLSGLPVYVISYNGFSCTGGWFDNDAPCTSCPVQIDIMSATCSYDLTTYYNPPAIAENGWGWSQLGSGQFGSVVPPITTPQFIQGAVSIPNFHWTYPDDFCETYGFQYSLIVGIINPPPSGPCPNIYTTYFGIGISCPTVALEGGGVMCSGSCPDITDSLLFSVGGFEPNILIDLLVTSSAFPPYPIYGFQVSDSSTIQICNAGTEPVFDSAAMLLTLPLVPSGTTISIEVVSGMSLSGCELNIDPTPVTWEFTDPPTITAGADITVCSDTDVELEALVGGSGTAIQWSTDGDGVFDDMMSASTIYHIGTGDEAAGEATLTVISSDTNGICTPDTSSLVVSILPAPSIQFPNDIEICSDSSASIQIIVTGDATIAWNPLGDGVLIIHNDTDITYTPGPLDIAANLTAIQVMIASVFPECGMGTYSIPVSILNCACPPLETTGPLESLCEIADTLDLSSLLVQGAPGTWTVTSVPMGINPAQILGNTFITANADAGLYTVTYTLNNPVAGCPDTSSESIEVSESLQPNLGPDLTLCVSDTAFITAQFNGALPTLYAWETTGQGTFSQTVSSAIYTPAPGDAGQTILMIYHVSDGPCAQLSDTVQITFDLLPFVVLQNDTAHICNASHAGSVISFSSFILDGDMSGLWTNPGNVPVDITDPSLIDFDGVMAGTYVFNYETTTGSACGELSYSFTVIVDECACALMIENLADTFSLCPGDTMILIPMVTGALGDVQSVWVGDTTITGLVFKAFEGGNVVWVVIDSTGCSARDSFAVVLTEEPIAQFELLPVQCDGMLSGTIVLEDILGTGPFTIAFDQEPLFLVTTLPDTIHSVETGTHTIVVTDMNGCTTSYDVSMNEIESGSVSLGPDETIEFGDSVLISPVINNIAIATVSWDPLFLPQQTESFYFTPSETITIQITLMDSTGCVYSDDKTITVYVNQNFFIPNVFSPNGDQINDLLEMNVSSIAVQSVEIFDRWGARVHESIGPSTPPWNGRYKGQPLPPGVYVLKMHYTDIHGSSKIHVQDITLLK